MVSQREHIDTVATRTNHPVSVVAEVVRAHLAVLTETVAAGESVTLTGFGTFSRTDRPTAGGGTATFKPGASLRKAVSGDETTAAAPAKKPATKKQAVKKPAAKAASKASSKTTPAKKRAAKKTTSKKTAK